MTSKIGMRQSERAGGDVRKGIGRPSIFVPEMDRGCPGFLSAQLPCTVVVDGVTERSSYSWNRPDDKVAAGVLVDVADLIETKG